MIGERCLPEEPPHPLHLFKAAKLMVVRRNDRRRRLMTDEFVPTIEPSQPTENVDPHNNVATTCATRRTYASGADRRNQLRTTDLFPKRTCLIVTFGLLMLSLIVGINVLAWNAQSWSAVIGPEGVAALQLSGAGTLASWFTCFLMVSVALVSLQIYAMRRHRCDDYVGTYRMWMWFPPIFIIASMASVVDVSTIARNVFDSTLGMSLPPGSLVPFVVALSVLAVLAGRVLYEVKDSRASVAVLVMAWLSLAVSITMQTEWAGNRIAAFDRQFVLGNSYLFSAVALLVGHLFYTRFVYLHAHGLIVRKPVKVARKAKKKVEPKKPARVSAESVAKPAKAKTKGDRNTVSAGAAAQKKTAKPTVRERAAVKPATVKTPKAANKQSVSQPAAKSKPATINSFKSLMEKRKNDQEAAAKQEVAEPEAPATIKMSKAERRRARKAKRASRKAA
jgi:hypothetical protein